jgi:flagellin
LSAVSTNRLALLAAQALTAAGASLALTQRRVATGLRVATAKDDGALWGMARMMRAETESWRVANNSLARGGSMLEVAAAGTERIVDLLGKAREKAVAFRDPSLGASARATLRADIQALIAQVDQAALLAEFDGRKPLADTLVQTTVIQTNTAYSGAPPNAPLTPASLAANLPSTSGGASSTFVRDGGTNPGRLDLYLDAYSAPDVLEIWQGGTRVAATGQAYVPGGAAVGPGAAVSGQQIVSFDYNPASGQALEFRFNEGVNASGSVWNVGGVALQNLSAPLPSLTTTSTPVTVTSSSATSYDFVSGAAGEIESVAARPLTVEALGLNQIDWNDPAPLLGLIDAALTTALDSGAYFGERQNALAQIRDQNSNLADTLEAGVGNLVDADLAKDSATLEAARIRTELATQSLGLANGQANWLLTLFRPRA